MANRLYETAIRISASISKAFKGDINNAAAALTKLTGATKQLKEAEKAAAAYKKLEDAVSSSKGRYDSASSALRKLEAAEKAAGGATKESTQWRKAGERELAKSSREFDRATKAAEKNGKALREMGVDTAHLATEQERLARTLAATERREKALSQYEGSRKRLFGKRHEATPLMQKAGEQFRGVASDAMVLGTAAAGATVAMSALVLKTLHAGEDVSHTAEMLGVGTTALQELRYAARQTGAETGSLDLALRRMAATVGKHKLKKGKATAAAIPGLQMLNTGSGTGSAAEADPFKQIHLSAKDLVKLKPEEQLNKIADAMAKLKTHDERAAVAQAIFGKGAADIIPLLSEGSAGIDKLSKDAHKFGGVLSVESVKAAHEADRAMKDAESAFAGVSNTLGAALLPTATKVFKEFSGWVADNRVEIKQWAESTAKWIETKGIPALKWIGGEVKSFASKVLYLVEGAAKLTGGFGNLAIVVAGLRLAPLATTLAKIAFEGTKAAIAVFKYVAATKAAQDAGNIPGGGGAGASTGNAIGLAAKAQMLLGAAAVGYAIGTALDQYFGLSDKLANHFGETSGQKAVMQDVENAGAYANDIALQRQKIEKAALIQKYEGMGLTHGQAVSVADRLSTRPSGGVDLSGLNISIGGGSREQVEQNLDAALEKVKAHVLDHLDKKHKHKRRVSFGQ